MARRQRFTVLITTPLGGDGVAVESFTLLVGATLRELGHLLYTATRKAEETLAAQRVEVKAACVRKRAATAEVEAKRVERAAVRQARIDAKADAKRRREEKREAKAARQAAIARRKEVREWLKALPERGDYVSYQEKPHGHWHAGGRVVGVAGGGGGRQFFKVSGDRGTHLYPVEQVRRVAPRERVERRT